MDYYRYTLENVNEFASIKSGVYKISFKQDTGYLKVRYIGQAKNILDRLKQHLDFKNEKNECLVERLRQYHAEFAYAVVDSQEDRDGAERALYNYYEPICNNSDAIPNGPSLIVNPR